MKILLHGATNCGSSNFGDFLYGDAVYRYLKKNYPDFKVQFFQPSSYFRKYISDYREFGISPWTTDFVLYIPGGYFGEGHRARLRDNLIHFLRFMPLGLVGLLFRKKIGVLGIGAGPIRSPFLKIPVRLIGKAAECLTVRDPESLDALRLEGIEHVEEFGDLILSLNPEDFSEDTEQLQKIRKQCSHQKILFVHYNHSKEAMEKFAATIAVFKKKNTTCQIVVGSDSILKNDLEMFEEFTRKTGVQYIHYRYDSPYELTRLLMSVDAVLTCKLHVGVVASLLGKSVISIAEHPEKTFRYYQQIAHPERSVSLYETSPDGIAAMLDAYCDVPLQVPAEEIEKSKRHWKVLKTVMDNGTF